jgi:signal-transduction protein with cAMP-binding, CBS, and nucleotidyltransferase domain
VYLLSKQDFDQLRVRYPDFDAQVKEVVASRRRDAQQKT